MSFTNLPDLEKAKSMAFSEIAKAIDGFIDDPKKNKALVSPEEIELLQNLVEVLVSKAPNVPPHPGPRPIEPQPPRLPHYPYDLRLDWLKPDKILTPKQEAYNQMYPKLFSEYELQKQEWKNALLPWEEAYNKNYQALNSPEHRIVKRFRRVIDQLLCSGGRRSIIRKVNWEFLPPGYWPIDDSSVASLFASKSSKAIIRERLIAATALDPFEIVIGKNEFNEYLCFRFRNNNKVLLESPYEGNAAYVLRGDWESLSKITKLQLMNIYSDFCERIIHGPSGNWKHEIKERLGM